MIVRALSEFYCLLFDSKRVRNEGGEEEEIRHGLGVAGALALSLCIPAPGIAL